MAEAFNVDVAEFSPNGKILRKNSSIGNTTSAVTLLPAPGAGLKYLILSVTIAATGDVKLTVGGYDVTEVQVGAKMILTTGGGGSYSSVTVGSMNYGGLFSTAANTALSVTPDIALTDGHVFVSYIVCKA